MFIARLWLSGYYKMPEYKIERLQIAGKSDAIIEMNATSNLYNSSLKRTLETKSVQTENESTDSHLKLDRYLFHQIIYSSIEYILSPHNMEMKIFMLTMLIMMAVMFVYFSAQVSAILSYKSLVNTRVENSPSLGVKITANISLSLSSSK